MEPAYRRIAAAYRDKISSGELAPGERLPTEHEIGEQFGVVRQTVRTGLGVLVTEGLIVARRPHGYFVREWERLIYRPQEKSRPMPARATMDRFSQQISDEGRVPSMSIDIALVQATPDLAERLRVEPGATVVIRRRVRFINGEPVNINDSHFPLDLVKDSEIVSPSYIPRGTDQVLADLGHKQERAVDEIFRTHAHAGRDPPARARTGHAGRGALRHRLHGRRPAGGVHGQRAPGRPPPHRLRAAVAGERTAQLIAHCCAPVALQS